MNNPSEIRTLSTQYVDDESIHVNLMLTYKQFVELVDALTATAMRRDPAPFMEDISAELDRHLQAIELQRECRPVVLDIGPARCSECGFFYTVARGKTGCPNCSGLT